MNESIAIQKGIPGWDDSPVFIGHKASNQPWNCGCEFRNKAHLSYPLQKHKIIIYLGATNSKHQWLFNIFPSQSRKRSNVATGPNERLCESGFLRYSFKVGDDHFYLLMETFDKNPLILPKSMIEFFYLFESFITNYPATMSGRFFHWLPN